MKLARVHPGCYKATVAVPFSAGDRLPCEAFVERTDDGHAWYWTIARAGGLPLLGGEDHYDTKREAVLGLEEAVERGFFCHPQLGWCLRATAGGAS